MTLPAVGSGHAAAPPDAGAHALALGFARQVERWAAARGVPPHAVALLRHAALALSLATSDGHVCIDLAQALADIAATGDTADTDDSAPSADGAAGTPDPAAARSALLASGLVGTPAAPHALPMILDGDGRLYLHRYFDYEQRLARRLVQAASMPAHAAATNAGASRALLAELFPPHAGTVDKPAVDQQQAAAALALRSSLAIISGGPGTGKTTTVVKLLACLLAQQPDARIALTAPTGKAAARMSQAMRERAALLPLPDAVRARLPSHASTVHRLLGVTPGPGGFVHHAGNPLAIDVLVVDEASMLDLALATRLLEAVPPHARIVLLGDKDQLSAVESGAVFAEISAERSAEGNARRSANAVLQDTVVWFTQNFRFAADSGIGRLAADTNAGRAAQALQTLRTPDDSVRWLNDSNRQPGADVWQQMLDGHAPFIDALRRNPRDVPAVTLAFNHFRVLCAVREGPRGALAVNVQAALAVRSALGDQPPNMQNEWYVGRPVMVLRNDPVLKLFNGDVGIALPDASGALMVHFPAADAQPDGTGWRAIPPLRLPLHHTAFAMTVHKAQGSEFDTVLVLLPERRSRVVTRELLYTAVTRARQRVLLCGGADVIAAAIQSPTQRHSGLLARLAEAAAAAGPAGGQPPDG